MPRLGLLLNRSARHPAGRPAVIALNGARIFQRKFSQSRSLQDSCREGAWGCILRTVPSQ
jgi:hypothetical protein